ncbi:HPF/RaiA family ribosome-associated protein [Marinimicrobium sp. ABcell2]|uniref:HPF/RaiA family ribosome-associated protein n=1 Tax=Marinimicrobium sp. ABcell2 TaxID=3069751 RepID=UPI0027B39830|nr:HPF/RaiA family ribosome-associated protein [Marinimicrobium sp. ABcell2]MDQ2076865.1 HPF/RaiA family ribosome-associated protein [Marinimicrobium sp. ABcell2]
MQIQVNTDNNIQGQQSLAERVRETVVSNLGRFERQITRVEVHLSDENGAKSGAQDKRCLMEVRLGGRQPMAVTDQSDSLEQAINGAAKKMKTALGSTLGRLDR